MATFNIIRIREIRRLLLLLGLLKYLVMHGTLNKSEYQILSVKYSYAEILDAQYYRSFSTTTAKTPSRIRATRTNETTVITATE